MNFFGIGIGFLSILVIGLGFVWVIRGERYLGYLWWPYFMALGICLVISTLFLSQDWISGLVGCLGASILWGSTELKEQAIRTELGWFPFRGKKIHPPFHKTIRKWKAPHL